MISWVKGKVGGEARRSLSVTLARKTGSLSGVCRPPTTGGDPPSKESKLHRNWQTPQYPGQRQSTVSCPFLGGHLNLLAKPYTLGFTRRTPGNPRCKFVGGVKARATVEVALWLIYFLNDGVPEPKIVGVKPFIFIITVVYLGHGIFHPLAVLIFLQISFWEDHVLS